MHNPSTHTETVQRLCDAGASLQFAEATVQVVNNALPDTEAVQLLCDAGATLKLAEVIVLVANNARAGRNE